MSTPGFSKKNRHAGAEQDGGGDKKRKDYRKANVEVKNQDPAEGEKKARQQHHIYVHRSRVIFAECVFGILRSMKML
jgi:hypothetical protein